MEPDSSVFAQVGGYFADDASWLRYFDGLIAAAEQAASETSYSWREVRLLRGTASVSVTGPDRAIVDWHEAHALVLVGPIGVTFDRSTDLERAANLGVPAIHLQEESIASGQLAPLPSQVHRAYFLDDASFRTQVANFIYANRHRILRSARQDRRSRHGLKEASAALRSAWDALSDSDRHTVAVQVGIDPAAAGALVADLGALGACPLRTAIALAGELESPLFASQRVPLGLEDSHIKALQTAATDHVWGLSHVIELALTGAEELAQPGVRRRTYSQPRDWEDLHNRLERG